MQHNIPLVTKLVLLILIANLGRDLPWLRQPNQIETLQIALAAFFHWTATFCKYHTKVGRSSEFSETIVKVQGAFIEFVRLTISKPASGCLIEWPLAHLFFPSVCVCFLTYDIASGVSSQSIQIVIFRC